MAFTLKINGSVTETKQWKHLFIYSFPDISKVPLQVRCYLEVLPYSTDTVLKLTR